MIIREPKHLSPLVWDAIRAIVRDEIKAPGVKKDPPAAIVTAEKPKAKVKQAAKAAVSLILVAGIGLLFGQPAQAKTRPRNIDSAYAGADAWTFGTTVDAPRVNATHAVLAPNPSSALTDWSAVTGMIYFDEDDLAIKYYDGTAWQTLSGI